MKKVALVTVSALALLFCMGGSCKPPPPPPPPPPAPVAAFVASPTSGEQPLTVSFTDQSTEGPTSWSWDFGDGVGTSTEQNPSYTYSSAGSYTVTLTATSANGSDTETKTDYIMVNEPPPPPPPELKASQLSTVYFDFDKFNLRDDAKAALDVNYNLLMEFPDAMIKIEGHCDERGTVEYNQSLGEKRARSAMEYLVGRGVPEGRLSVISYGKERPVDPGHNEAAWQKNRRCEFRIVSQ